MEMEERNQLIRKLREIDGLTLEEISKKFGITRERVRQICVGCKKPITGKLVWLREKINSDPEFFMDKTVREMADLFDISHPTVVSRYLSKIHHAVATNSSVYKGEIWERWVHTKLKDGGIESELMPCGHPFDLLLSNGVRVDVKASYNSHYIPGGVNPRYKFGVRAGKRKDADFYVCIISDTSESFIIPTSAVPDHMGDIYISWPTSRPDIGKYQKYYEAWDLLS